MNERLMCIPLTYGDVAGGGDADVVAGFEAPVDMILVGASLSLDMVSGSPDGITLDFNDDDAAISSDYTAVSVGTTAGVVTQVKSTHFGGTIAPVRIAAGSEVDMDINIAGGSTPKARITALLWVLV